jgi:hypothetical protein
MTTANWLIPTFNSSAKLQADIDLGLLDTLEETLRDEIDDCYIPYRTEDFEVEYELGVSICRRFYWDCGAEEPGCVIELGPCGNIISTSDNTPSDLIIQIANISINILMGCFGDKDLTTDQGAN